MNLKVMPNPKQPSIQHLTHEQLCDLLLHDDLDVHALHGDAALSTAAADQLAACQEHLRDCLICAAELEIMRGAVARFQTATDALISRELSRRPLPNTFSPLHSARSHGYAIPAFFWATAALLVAALLPLNLFHLKSNPLLHHPTTAQPGVVAGQIPESDYSSDSSDAALLDDIDQHLSAAVPEPMQPLDNPAATEAATEPSN